jgi:hypothetical protein
MPHVTDEDNEPTRVPVNVLVCVPVNGPANETVDETVNARQQWCIAQVIAGRQPGWADLAQLWQVSRATAKGDIAGLKARGLIEFVGAPKTGFYRIVEQLK